MIDYKFLLETSVYNNGFKETVTFKISCNVYSDSLEYKHGGIYSKDEWKKLNPYILYTDNFQSFLDNDYIQSRFIGVNDKEYIQDFVQDLKRYSPDYWQELMQETDFINEEYLTDYITEIFDVYINLKSDFYYYDGLMDVLNINDDLNDFCNFLDGEIQEYKEANAFIEYYGKEKFNSYYNNKEVKK